MYDLAQDPVTHRAIGQPMHRGDDGRLGRIPTDGTAAPRRELGEATVELVDQLSSSPKLDRTGAHERGIW